MRRYMIVANQTLGGHELLMAIKERMAAGPSEFWVVVPATPVTHLELGIPMPVMGGVPAIPGTPEEARKLAQSRLDAEIEALTGAGATVDGEVGDADPVKAVEAAMASSQFDEIIVATLPVRLSRWLHQDLPRRLEHKTNLPVTHVRVAKGE